MLDIDKAFNPETKSVHAHYQSPGVGFYIPLYQREYSWDDDNIDQLLDDVAKGVDSLAQNPEKEIRFLGTIIAVKVMDSKSIYPRDPKGLPSLVENIIDGQQRLSTIALFSTLLYEYVLRQEEVIKGFKGEEDKKHAEELLEACKFWKEKLIDVFSLDLKRGTPQRKPKIIRGNKDQWTKDGAVPDNYKSDVAKFLGLFIDYLEGNGTFPKLDRNTKVGKNLKKIDSWIRNKIIKSHVDNSDDFLPAWEIITNVKQEDIWQYERADLVEIVQRKEKKDKKSVGYITCSLVQLFAVCHYLLDRCCFTIIQPLNEEWAFDMFQSLNATGTPLTSIETFKPNVVNCTKEKEGKFKDSDADVSFAKVENLFEDCKNASSKSRRAKDFLTSFALSSTGYKLESHFSKQRKWLDGTYRNKRNPGCETYEIQKEFIHFFGDYAQFYKDVWIDYKGANNLPLYSIATHEEAQLVSLLIIFLKDSSHKMAITVLGRFYTDILKGKDNSISDFVAAVKMLAAFYTLWRAAYSNSGLDNVYRSFFKGPPANYWLKKRDLDLDDLKNHLADILREKGASDKESWLAKAKSYTRYNRNKSICKLALYISSHDTIPDPNNLGLMKKGVAGTAPYLDLKSWNSLDLKTVEHVAPQSGNTTIWDSRLYKDDEFQHIGNLTLLPNKVNISASNKSWKEKHLYYLHLSERDPNKLKELSNKAKSRGITLAPSTIGLLQKSNFNNHMEPIVALGELGLWDFDFVEKRSVRILELVWDMVGEWVFY